MDASRRLFKGLPSTAPPIAVTEFLSALSKVWSVTRSSHREAETFGIAISGGVDSMALAALCSRLQSIHLSTGLPQLGFCRKIGFRAFVVDHGVRAESTVEANSVARILEQRGIRTQVLRINWDQNERPSERPNFESLARAYRYQLMGKACRDLGIRSLLLAHHEDDQAETVLMRLIKGHGRPGLVGMRTAGGIPECYGIHGVYESGEATILDGATSIETDLKHARKSEQKRQLPIETGGIKVYRPLLSVGKDRLIATCQTEGMEWFEDHTNSDPTLTTRNAIRHIYKSYHMPTALTKPSLLKLSERCRAATASQHKATELWLAKCSITGFETRTGILNVKFAHLEDLANMRQTDSQLIAAGILRNVINLVTPEEHVPLSNLFGAVKRVFPELFPNQKLPIPSAAFTVAGVEFRPVHENIPTSIDSSSSSQKEEKCRWLVSRQPYTFTPSNRPTITVLPSDTPLSDIRQKQMWSEWFLYDGRYWIRIKNQSRLPVLVRPFLKTDVKKFRGSLSVDDRTKLDQLLKWIAPGAVRWTLPSLVVRNSDDEAVSALPSLDIRARDLNSSVEWEIRYKKLDMTCFPELDSLERQ